MRNRTITDGPPYCMFCAMHNHAACRNGECECAARDHDPEVRVAAAMQRYVRPDLARDDDVGLANRWREADGR